MKSINEAGIALIKEFEGLALKGYQKTGDVPTIGYGHTGPDVRVGQQITELDTLIDRHRPDWSRVRWINVTGGNREEVLNRFADQLSALVGRGAPKTITLTF